MKKYYLFLICIGAVFNVIAAQNTTEELVALKEKINRAIIKVEHTERALWSYKISRYEDEEGDISSSIEQHSPQTSERWLLKQINGQLPTKKQIKNFAKKKQEQSNTRKQEGNIKLTLRELINQKSLSLVSTDDKHIIMAFNVYWEKLGKDSIGKLQGKLVYQKEQQFIEKISIWNNAEFSPMFTANITDFALTFTFLNINGAVLVKQNEMKMKGSFAYFTEINEISLDNFSDYVYQGQPIQ
ncbi:hypothetical protein [Thalassotalea sp. ND16A]|uniref:hypothetical protein n=1 Tax=Thalassotalea sp. ND16A TaxID=1535422 RepID=UPI00051A044B|nr:hypothetical protein [Thalassotalea sp. ND16A]KGJ89964.1 hypothetical protein ND16A_2062 [Thalassotalea sp. ND16A]